MFSHLNNLLVVFMARYRCKGCMSIIGVDEKAAFYIRLYRVIGYPATIKRSMWQGKTTDRMDCLLSQQGYAFRSEFFFKGHQSEPYSFRRQSFLPQKISFTHVAALAYWLTHSIFSKHLRCLMRIADHKTTVSRNTFLRSFACPRFHFIIRTRSCLYYIR